MAAMGYAPTNDTERGLWNKGLKSLRQSEATPEQIAERCALYRDRYGPEIPLHPLALAKNWTQLYSPVPVVSVAMQDNQEVSSHATTRNCTRRHHLPFSCQADEEQPNTGQVDQRLAAGGQALVVFAEAAGASEPRNRPLNDPAAR